MPRVSVNAQRYHRVLHNLTVTDYSFRTPSDYSALNVVSPLDGEVITVYNISAPALTRVERVDFASSSRQQIYDGYELGFATRLPGGAQLFGGTTATQHTLNANCDQPDDPNQIRFCRRPRPAESVHHATQICGVLRTPVVGYPDERLAAKRAWPAAPDQLEYRQDHAVRGRLQGAVCLVRWWFRT